MKLTVHLPQSTIVYPIHIGMGLLSSSLLLETCRSAASRWILVADTSTEKLYGRPLQHFLSNQGLTVELFAFPPGELHKTRSTKEWIEDQMLSKGYGRDSGLMALGGGIVTDLGGFVASTYCRGLPLIQIPTTLLAMVDASIGGKTAVNVPNGKNMIGTIYQPLAVFMDVAVLKTLPREELQNGIVESIKHGIIFDAAYFNLLEQHVKEVLELDFALLEPVIAQSCHIKQQIVEQDEREMGMRRLLNFGHTIGHALETLTDHTVPHGQAVAIGMMAESYLSMQLGILKPASFDRIIQILRTYGIRINVEPTPSPQDFLEVMKLDKKSLKSTPRFVIVQEIGSCRECEGQYCQSVETEALQNTLHWICDVMRAH